MPMDDQELWKKLGRVLNAIVGQMDATTHALKSTEIGRSQEVLDVRRSTDDVRSMATDLITEIGEKIRG